MTIILRRKNRTKFISAAIVLALVMLSHGPIAKAATVVAVSQGPWGTPASSVLVNSAVVTTSGASYLLAGVTADRQSGTAPEKIVSVAGGGLNWVKLAGGTMSFSEMASEYWGAYSNAALSSVTITVTVNNSSNIAFDVIALSGVNAAAPVGVKTAPSSVANNLSVTFNGTTAGSMLFAVGFSYGYDGEAVTGGSGTTVYDNQNLVTQHIRSTSSIAGGTQTISSTGYTGGPNIYYVGVEIMAALGSAMSSPNFIIVSDDLSTGGGNSTSASFVSESDVGGKATGEDAVSSSFKACAGYPCTLDVSPPSITFTVSPTSIALGTLTSAATATGTTTITTTSNAANGYSTTVIGDGHLRTAGGSFIGDVTDGAVTTGADEYGIGLSGTDKAFSDDEAVNTTPLTVAANSGTVTSSAVVVTFKAAPGSTSAAGKYSQIATFITSGSF